MKNNKNTSKYLYIIYLLINLVFLVQVFKLGMLPTKYILIVAAILIIIALLLYVGLIKSKKSKPVKISKGIAVILSIFLIVANLYLYRGGSFINKISGGLEKRDTVSVIVRKDSPYETLEDVKNLTFVFEDDNESIVMDAIADYKTRLGQDISIQAVDSYVDMANELLNGGFEVMILNEAYRNIINDDVPNFDEETRIIGEFTQTTVIQNSDVSVTKDTFAVMISGIDVYGSISNNSRSDVNILAVVNPVDKKMVLVSIPRDYYVPFTCNGGIKDKLTHTGIRGVDCTMNTVGQLFGIEVDFYARVNFSSLINVVNAVGGVTVYNDAAFSAGKYNFPAGENYLDGEKALVFVRDRYHQADGDSGRGRNQVKVLTAIINKMISPSLITNFNSILGSLEGSFQTNLSSSQINSLVKMQLNDMSGWDIIQEQVTGTGGSAHSPGTGRNQYMMFPNMQSVAEVKQIIMSLYK